MGYWVEYSKKYQPSKGESYEMFLWFHLTNLKNKTQDPTMSQNKPQE